MKKNTLKFGASILFIASTIFTACIKDEVDLTNLNTNWTPEFGIPLVNSELTISDILAEADKNKNIQIGSDGFLTLVYEGELFSRTAENVFFPDKILDSAYLSLDPVKTASVNALPINTTIAYSFTNVVKLKVIDTDPSQSAPILLDKILYKSGDIFIKTVNNLKQEVEVKVEFPNITKNGVALFGITKLAPKTSIQTVSGLLLDLSGYEIDLTQSGGSATDEFKAIYTFTIKKTANTSVGGESIQMNPSIRNQKFRRIIGDCGQRSLSPNNDTVNIGIFKNAIGGDFRIKNPTVELKVINSFGIPVNLNLAELKGFDKPTNTIYPVNIPVSVQNINLLGPAYTNASFAPIDESTQIFLVDTSNSGNSADPGNIKNILNKKPKQFVYKVTSLTNPLGAPTGNKNVVFNDSKFQVDFKLKLPLEGFASSFTFIDTTKFDVGNIPAEITSIKVRNFMRNGFPLDAFVQLYFIDSTKKVIDSLITTNDQKQILKAAAVDVNNKVISSTNYFNEYVVDAIRANKWKGAKNVVIKASANTLNAPSKDVKIYDYYKIDFKLGIIAKGNVNLKR